MKRRYLISHLLSQGAEMIREGRRHTIFGKGQFRTQVPRHTEIVDELAAKICKDLKIPLWKG